MNMKSINYDIRDAQKELGEYLSGWRRLLGITSAQVADRAGIARSTYSKIENGSLNVSALALLNVLRALGLLDKTLEAIDPYNSDLGRMQADQQLPKRVRHRKPK
jgi:transcriptional regulator with XRE-family HTH domain